jgi:hypothetical protein
VTLKDHDFLIESNQVIMDTGTSYILLPMEDYLEVALSFTTLYTCSFNPAYGFLFSCGCTDKEYESYPPFEFEIDGDVYTLEKEYYVVRENGNCLFKLMHYDFPSTNSKAWILGLTFF